MKTTRLQLQPMTCPRCRDRQIARIDSVCTKCLSHKFDFEQYLMATYHTAPRQHSTTAKRAAP